MWACSPAAVGAGRCTGGLGGSSAAARTRREPNGELRTAPGLAAKFAAARADRKTACRARSPTSAGDDLAAAGSAAKAADVAIVFGYQLESEGLDLKSLDLSEDQNKLIETVAAANPKTIVVLETGSPATMPWIDKVAGVVEAWYPGIRGAEALANLLTGEVNPSGKLAITFPQERCRPASSHPRDAAASLAAAPSSSRR